jgi:hypothetical protein
MPYAAQLGTAFVDSKVTRIAIVDDAYDPVDFSGIDTGSFSSTTVRLKELVDEEPGAAELSLIETELGAKIGQVVSTIRETAVLDALFRLFVQADPESRLREILRPLFVTLNVDRTDKLRPLIKLSAILEAATGVKADEFDSSTSPSDVADYDLIFLDFYLSDDVPALNVQGVSAAAKASARQRSIAFLEEVVRLGDAKSATGTPMVMLISSMASADELPEFRRTASMLASKMAFLPKAMTEKDIGRTQYVIAGLARHRAQADALWGFLRDWKKTVDQAAEGMMTSLRELELTDYSYMQEFRLTAEKTPLSQYVASLFSGRLTDLVERQMQADGTLKSLSKLGLDKAIPGRVSPTAAITDIYSSVPVADGDFQPKAWAGDIFLDTRTYNEVFATQTKVKARRIGHPQVLAVITPACDLIPERSKTNPLQTVTMIGGELTPLMETSGPTTSLLMLNNKPYSVRWNTKWPVTSPLAGMNTTSALQGRYHWAARLRDLYHAELQHMLFSDVGRVGVPVPPPMPEYVGVRVLARTGQGSSNYEVVKDYAEDTHSAWSFGANKNERAFCLREDIVWEISAWVEDNEGRIGDQLAEKLRRWTGTAGWIEELERPIMFRHDSAKGLKSSNGVSYRRAAKPFEEAGDTEQTMFLVIFGATSGSQPPAPPLGNVESAQAPI